MLHRESRPPPSVDIVDQSQQAGPVEMPAPSAALLDPRFSNAALLRSPSEPFSIYKIALPPCPDRSIDRKSGGSPTRPNGEPPTASSLLKDQLPTIAWPAVC